MPYDDEEEKRKIARTQAMTAPLQQATAGLGGQLAQQRGSNPLQQAGLKLGTKLLGSALGGPLGGIVGGLFKRGTTNVGPLGMKGYQQGTDSVPAMLTPGEAVIPAEAAQHPQNKQAIQGMVQQGRSMQDGGMSPMPGGVEMMAVGGPLSGKGKREEMKVLQDMSLKKKSWMADEKRKQESHEQKMSMDKMKGALAMKQSQE